MSDSKYVNTVCRMPDEYRCGLSVHVVDGAIDRIRPYGFPDKRDTFACKIGLAAKEMVYHPDRLHHPLKRVGNRGGGEWQRMTWDEVLNEIAGRLQDISGQFGPRSVGWLEIPVMSLGLAGYMRLASLIGGTLIDWLTAGDSALPCSDRATFNTVLAGELYTGDFEEPQLTIVWGYNPAVTRPKLMRKLADDRKKRCRLVVIDPRKTATASRCDEYIPIRPGTDGALALGMIHEILKQGLQDEPFIMSHTVGSLLVREDNGLFLREDTTGGGEGQRYMMLDRKTGQAHPADSPGILPELYGRHVISGIACAPAYQLLSDMVQEYTPDKVAEITDVPADTVRRLAVSYATQKPASIYRGFGMQRSFHGDLACRSINALAAVSGNINLKKQPGFVINWQPFLTPGGPCGTVSVPDLYDMSKPSLIKALMVANHNPVNQLPDMNKLMNDVLPRMELIVVCDLFMTATARYADYVLPVASFLECTDLVMSMGGRNKHLCLQQKAIEPLDECKSHFQIATELGKRLGFAQHFDKTEEQYIEEIIASSNHPSMHGITMDQLKKGPVLAPPAAGVQKPKTPTGKIEFYVEELKQVGQELPLYMEPPEGARSEGAKTYPLVLLTAHSADRLNSTMSNVSSVRRTRPEPFLDIHPVDATARNIEDGKLVRVYNDRGHVILKARFSTDIKPGVVNIEQGWSLEQYVEGHHNQLTHARINKAQTLIYQPNAAYFDTLVQVEKVL